MRAIFHWLLVSWAEKVEIFEMPIKWWVIFHCFIPLTACFSQISLNDLVSHVDLHLAVTSNGCIGSNKEIYITHLTSRDAMMFVDQYSVKLLHRKIRITHSINNFLTNHH